MPTRPARALVGDGRLVLGPLGGSSGGSVEVYDVDSRRLVSRTPGRADDACRRDRVGRSARARPGRARSSDLPAPRRRPGRYVGKRFDNEPQLLGVLGDTVVVSYEITSPLDRTARYYGFDVATGEQRWTTSPDRTFVLGRRGDDLLTASLGGPGIAGVAKEGPTGEDTAVFVLGQAPADDPSAQALLGTVTANGSWGLDFDTGWTEDVFLVQTDDTLTAYRLPQPGKTPLPVPEQRVDWADGDIRSEQAVDLCEGVRPSTLRSLGFRSLRLPPPAGCSWMETFEPDGIVRRLTAQAFALAPRKDVSGAEFATQNLAKLRHDETNRFRADTRYAGLGDEAWSDQNRRRRQRSQPAARPLPEPDPHRRQRLRRDPPRSAPERPRVAAPPGQGRRGRARARRHGSLATSAHGYSSPGSRSSRAVTAVSGKSENTPSMPSS